MQLSNKASPFHVWANSTYSGLGRKISEREVTNRSLADGVADGKAYSNDLVFYLATDLMGRRVATFRDTVTNPRRRGTALDGVAGMPFR